MIRRPPRATRTDQSFPTRRSSDLASTSIHPQNGMSPATNIAQSAAKRRRTASTSPATLASIQLSATALFSSGVFIRSEEHTSELQSLMRISYAVFCLTQQTPQSPCTLPHTQQHRNLNRSST